MKKIEFQVGQKFGYWTVIDSNPIIKSAHTYVKVRCKCGKEDYKCLSDLNSGRSTGCRNCKARERSRQIQIGDSYKKWTVIAGPRTNSHQCIEWLCQCECGNQRWIQGNELMNLNRCFACHTCAGQSRKEALTLRNGRVGELTLSRYSKIQRSANIRNIPFEVSMEYLWHLFESQKHICAITGNYIEHLKNASLDRIDSTRGYIEGNVQWVTYQANVSKHTMSMGQLYNFCKKVLNHANQQPSISLTTDEGSETNS